MMSKLKRFAAALAAASILTAHAAAAGIGSVISSVREQVSNTGYLTVTESDNGKPQKSFVFEYAPGSDLKPEVAFGFGIYGRETLTSMINTTQSDGSRVTGAVNGDFFSFETGIPIGLAISGGKFLSSENGEPAIGFKKDGTAFIGKPQSKVTYIWNGKEYNVGFVNKYPSVYTTYLLTPEYGASTMSAVDCVEVLFKTDGSHLTLGGSVSCTVVSVGDGVKNSPIPDGHMVLSTTKKGPCADMLKLKPGDKVTFKVENLGDAVWEEAECAIGGSEILVKNGAVVSGLSKSAEPRTAVGIKADGTVVAFAVDGRQSSYSAGLGLHDTAAYMLELGCVEALNLDGGCSTTVAVKLPLNTQASVQNRPSDGSQRRVSTALLFVNTAKSDGVPKRIHFKQKEISVFGGETVALDMEHFATDAAWQPCKLGGAPKFTVMTEGLGEIIYEDGVYKLKAGRKAMSGIIRAEYNGIYGEIGVVVLEGAEELLLSPGYTVTSGDGEVEFAVTLLTGDTEILIDNSSVEWSINFNGGAEIGTVTDGVFRRNPDSAKGKATVTAKFAGMTATAVVELVNIRSAVAENFEALSRFNVISTNASASASLERDAAFRGDASLKLDYDLTGGSVRVEERTAKTLKGFPMALEIWIWGANDDLRLYASVKNSSDTEITVEYLPVGTADGEWVKFRANLQGKGFTSGELVCPIIIEGEGSGTLLLDNLTTYYGVDFDDTRSPEIELLHITDGGTVDMPQNSPASLMVRLKDNPQGSGIEHESIRMYLDGVLKSAYYSPMNGTAECEASKGLAPGLHKLTVYCTDLFGNRAMKSFQFTVSGEKPSPGYDDAAAHWSKDIIAFTERAGIYGGMDYGDAFKPEEYITKAEFCLLFTNFLKIDVSAYKDIALPYGDADSLPEYAENSIKALYALGYLDGLVPEFEDEGMPGTFGADRTLTRAELAVMLARTFKHEYNNGGKGKQFSDLASLPEWMLPYFRNITEMNIILGYPDGAFRPYDGVKRCEMAVVFFKLY